MHRVALRCPTRSFRNEVATLFVRRLDQPFSAKGAASGKRASFDGGFSAISVVNLA